MIISGFPCIGKSTISGAHIHIGGVTCIDLESSMFFVDGKRPDNWEEIYVNIASDLDIQGYCVFVSSHKSVRDALLRRGIEFHSLYPSKDLYECWKAKLSERYEACPTEKNKRAMDYILAHYDESIDDMSRDPHPHEIDDVKYNLETVVDGFVHEYRF